MRESRSTRSNFYTAVVRFPDSSCDIVAQNPTQALEKALASAPYKFFEKNQGGYAFEWGDEMLAFISIGNVQSLFGAQVPYQLVCFITKQGEFISSPFFEEIFRFRFSKKLSRPKRRIIFWLAHYYYVANKQCRNTGFKKFIFIAKLLAKKYWDILGCKKIQIIVQAGKQP